jgi:hypothetical protein
MLEDNLLKNICQIKSTLKYVTVIFAPRNSEFPLSASYVQKFLVFCLPSYNWFKYKSVALISLAGLLFSMYYYYYYYREATIYRTSLIVS